MYRIVEDDGAGGLRAVAEFDSAYDGAAALRSALLRTRARAARWKLLDARGRVLAEPEDVLDSLA